MKNKLKAKLLLGVFSLSTVFGFVGNNFAGAVDNYELLRDRLMAVVQKAERDTRCAALKKYLETEEYAKDEEPYELNRDWKRQLKIEDYVNKCIKRDYADPISVAVYAAVMDKSEDEVKEMFILEYCEKRGIAPYEMVKVRLLHAAIKLAVEPRCAGLVRYLEDQRYICDESHLSSKEQEDVRARNISKYVHENFEPNSKDETSVIIYAALMDKNVEETREMMMDKERQEAEEREEEEKRKAAEEREKEEKRKEAFSARDIALIKGSKKRLLIAAHAFGGDKRCQDLVRYLESKRYRDASLPDFVRERICFINISNYVNDHFAPNPADEVSVSVYAALMKKSAVEVQAMFELIANSEGKQKLVGRLRLALARLLDDPKCQKLGWYLDDIDADDDDAISRRRGCTNAPEWEDNVLYVRMLAICNYINSNFEKETSDPTSVAIYAAMMDKTCEETVAMFLAK